MERGIFRCPSRWLPFLPPQVRCPSLGELASPPWDLLALTREGARAACGTQIRCQRLLLPGDCPVCAKAQVVISYGLSPRDSLTLSGVRQPVLCIQRTLPGAGRGTAGASGDPTGGTSRTSGDTAGAFGSPTVADATDKGTVFGVAYLQRR